MRELYHALVLNMHQPPRNLENLLETNEWEVKETNEWEVKEILFAYDRMPRALWAYQDIARIHLSLSGTLLETLSNPDFQNRVYGTVDCGKCYGICKTSKSSRFLAPATIIRCWP